MSRQSPSAKPQVSRQGAFNKLRSPCVELSQIVLKFRGHQTTAKDVLQALRKTSTVISQLGQENALDPKLADYAFFPLSQIFNESRRLSSNCLEIAVQCLNVLVSQGWQDRLVPDMSKQLLILMTLLASGRPGQAHEEPVSDDLKVACFHTIDSLVEWMTKSPASKEVLGTSSTAGVVDQVVYLLLEAITESELEMVQLSASKALYRLINGIHSRHFLASLLPRTVSSLVNAIRPSVRIRRSVLVLEADLTCLSTILRAVLRDEVALPHDGVSGEPEAQIQTDDDDARVNILDQSWLKATSSQVHIALVQVSKLRYHDRVEVRKALFRLCLVVITDCRRSLYESVPVILESMITLASHTDDEVGSTAYIELKQLSTIEKHIADEISSIFRKWTFSLPRIMQGSDDQPKMRAIGEISTAYLLLSSSWSSIENVTSSLTNTLVNSVSASIGVSSSKEQRTIKEILPMPSEIQKTVELTSANSFPPILFNHKSQSSSAKALANLFSDLAAGENWKIVTRSLIDRVPDLDLLGQISSIWLALQLLKCSKDETEVDDVIVTFPKSEDMTESKSYLISDLYHQAIPYLLKDFPTEEVDWRLKALAMEVVVLQAEQLGHAYRPELIDILYPVLSLFASSNQELRQHAIISINSIARNCGYPSTQALLIYNVDYLINSVAIKLNCFDLSPQGPQVLLMMIRLCGPTLLPYLDDIIGTIFAALDSFHGYPNLVELLFEVLKTIVDESAKQPQLAIIDGKVPEHLKRELKTSSIDDVLSDLAAARSRRMKSDEEHEQKVKSFPNRPWSALENQSNQVEADTKFHENTDKNLNDYNEELGAVSNPKDSETRLSKSYKLLLDIARATIPHLSSPSPHVRLTLLQLLSKIAPLLSQDEDSFLPLVNAIWPAIISRLFRYLDLGAQHESAYNVIAAAHAIVTLCEGAGDFLASRIEDIFPKLEQLFREVLQNVKEYQRRESPISGLPGPWSLAKDTAGPVDLQIVQRNSGDMVPAMPPLQQMNMTGVLRTTSGQILNALISLWEAILKHVRITEEHGESVLDMLGDVMEEPGRETVREALERWNADAVWLLRNAKKMGNEAGVEKSLDAEQSRKLMAPSVLNYDWARLGLSEAAF